MKPELAARRAVGEALKAGKIAKPPECSNCLAPGYVEAHHPDYGKPLDVVWLCRPCHMAIHKTEKPKRARTRKLKVYDYILGHGDRATRCFSRLPMFTIEVPADQYDILDAKYNMLWRQYLLGS